MTGFQEANTLFVNLKAPRLGEGLIKIIQYAAHENLNEKPQFCGDQKFLINYISIHTVMLAIAIAISIRMHM